MVKHPKYQAMDDARQGMIPRAFEMFTNDDYKMERVEPKIPKEPIPGPIPRPTFNVINKKTGDTAAVFYPNGYAECKDEAFKKIFDKISKKVERAAKDAYEDFLGH